VASAVADEEMAVVNAKLQGVDVQPELFGCPAKGFLASFFNQRVPKDFTAILGDEDEVAI
jgi:hypothetical protein